MQRFSPYQKYVMRTRWLIINTAKFGATQRFLNASRYIYCLYILSGQILFGHAIFNSVQYLLEPTIIVYYKMFFIDRLFSKFTFNYPTVYFLKILVKIAICMILTSPSKSNFSVMVRFRIPKRFVVLNKNLFCSHHLPRALTFSDIWNMHELDKANNKQTAIWTIQCLFSFLLQRLSTKLKPFIQ